jgi:diguanylate cyclase (GGDEF)-like protein
MRDALTGLPNEQIFRGHLAGEFARAREQERNGAFLAVRLDDIIAINAQHGRAGGDEALRAVANILEGYRAGPGRESHAAFKLGGPLFGYSIPACTAPEARTAAEEIHDRVQISESFVRKLTVSIGVVNYYELFMEDGTREQMALRIEQTALHRLGIAARQGANTISDSSEISDAAVSARPRVLVVDPEPESVELLVRALEAADLTVVVVKDGEAALEAVAAAPPSAIVCEAMTPRLNGFIIRERLRTNALWNAIPFILVSHRKNEELIRKAVEADIRHFFRKPVSLTEVTGLLVNITRSRAP